MKIKQLHNEMKTFSAKNGVEIYKVYTSLIDYMSGWMDVSGHPVDGWRYGKEQNAEFHKMMKLVIQAVGMAMMADSWRDPFGDIFMEYLGNKDLRGQCFTPEAAANLCARITMDETPHAKQPCGIFEDRIVASDPACGSGRMLLAAARYMELQRGENIYCIGEDIDTTCVKQTAINLALHGCYGEVVCHDTLKNPDTMRFGYIVNEGIYPDRMGQPNIRYSETPGEFVVTSLWHSAKPKRQPVQLTLFDL